MNGDDEISEKLTEFFAGEIAKARVIERMRCAAIARRMWWPFGTLIARALEKYREDSRDDLAASADSDFGG